MNSQPNKPRRQFLADVGMGFTGLALSAMLHRDGVARGEEHAGWSPPSGVTHFAPKAKSVIWLFMIGGTSHMESFDPKPALNKYAGKTIGRRRRTKRCWRPHFLSDNVRVVVRRRQRTHPAQALSAAGRLIASAVKAASKVSDWWPHVASVRTTSPLSARCGRPTTITVPSCSSTPAGTMLDGLP